MRSWILQGWLAAVIVLVAALGAVAQSAIPVQYYYDDAGRLTTVVNGSGQYATYSYDALGNILAIHSTALSSPNAPAIFNFTPQRGPAGTTVTIQGQGFDSSPGNDTVRFNGVAATVS